MAGEMMCAGSEAVRGFGSCARVRVRLPRRQKVTTTARLTTNEASSAAADSIVEYLRGANARAITTALESPWCIQHGGGAARAGVARQRESRTARTGCPLTGCFCSA